MEFQRKQINNLALSVILLLLLTLVIVGQKKEKIGQLYGHVVMAIPNQEYGELLSGATVELSRLNKRIIIISDEGGVVDENLPAGKYRLLAVKNKEGKLLTFHQSQSFYFEIKTNKTTRFDISVLVPKDDNLRSNLMEGVRNFLL